MKKIIMFLLLILLVSFTTVKAAGLSYSIRDMNVFEGNGLIHKNIDADVTNDNGTKSRQNIHLVEMATDSNLEVAVWSKINAQGKTSGATVMDIAKDFETKNPDYEVYAAVNGDYFIYSASTGFETVNANRLFNDEFYKDTNHTKYLSVAIDHNGKFVSENKQLTYGDYELVIHNKDNQLIGIYEFKTLNKRVLKDGETTVYINYDTFNPLTIDYIEVIVDSYKSSTEGVSFRGTSTTKKTGTNKTGTDVAKIVSSDPKLYEMVTTDSKVILHRKASNISSYTNVIGVDSRIVTKGGVRDFNVIGGQSESNNTLRHPRTGFGFKEDGTLVMFTVDGRQLDGAAGIVSQGVDLREFGQIMKQNGIAEGYNLDGGGSTQLVMRVDGQLQLINSPSEGPNFPNGHTYYRDQYRSVVNALLYVKRKSNVKIVPNITDNTLTLNIQNFSNISNGQVVFNGQTFDVKETLTFDLSKQKRNIISVLDNDNKVIYNNYFDQVEEPIEILPLELDIGHSYNQATKKLTIDIRFDDPDNTIDMMRVTINELEKTDFAYVEFKGLRRAEFTNIEPGSYTFIITTDYKNQPIHETSYSAVLENEDIDDNDDLDQNPDTPDIPEKNQGTVITVSIAAGVVVLLAGGIFIWRRRK